MDFRLTADQLNLAETIRNYLSGTHGPEVLRRLDAEGARDAAVWQGLVDMGLTGLLIPEAHGGLGLGLVEAALIAAECGRACVAEPLVDTACVAVPWLLACGETSDFAAILAGECKIALPHTINPWVADGEGPALESVDPPRQLVRAPDERTGDAHLLDLGALMAAAQMIGAADAMLTQAVEYAKPVVWRAAAALDKQEASASLHVSHAKVAATDAAMLTAETAIQVHGAMGYTYEVDLHFWMKRCWALAGAWGARAFHLKRVDDAVIGGGIAIGPEHTFA